MNKQLIIFIKNPELGKAKTRIAKTTGDKKALSIYLELLQHTRATVQKSDCHRHLFYSNFIDKEDAWSNTDFSKKLQINGGLGEKMQAAFQEVHDRDDRTLIIGSDCGELTPQIIDQAFVALLTHDVVLGPTFDGGYYMIGMRKAHPELFQDIDWSTEQVYPQTLHKLKKNSTTYFELPRLHDIDFEEDYLAWRQLTRHIHK